MIKIDIAGKDGEVIVYGDGKKVMEQLATGIALAVEMIEADQKEEVTPEIVLSELFKLVKKELSSEHGEVGI